MKAHKGIVLLILSLLLFTVFATSGIAQVKIGFVNSSEIIAKYKKAQDVDQKLAAEWKKAETELDNMKKELDNRINEYDNQRLLLSDEKKAQTQQELRNLEMQMTKFQKDKFGNNGSLAKLRQDMYEPIIKDVQDAIDEISKDEKFDIVFDAIAGSIVYVSEEKKKDLDLTQKVLERLQKDEKK